MSFAGFLGDVLGGALKNDNLRDYQHASRTFRSGNYALLPKFKSQWHICFEFNSEAMDIIAKARAQTRDNDKSLRYGSHSFSQDKLSVLCKSVKLPSYKFDVKKYNQYNRQVIGINKINYDPVSMEFHDDSLNVVRSLWDAYYTYYIQDSRYRRMSSISNQGIKVPKEWQQDSDSYSALYNDTYPKHWGLDTVNSKTADGEILDRIVPFFDSIKIYHFSRPVDAFGSSEDEVPHYAEYTLVNPIITSFEHDTLDYSSSETTKNNMSIEYETVLYAQGTVDEDFTEIASFKNVRDRYMDKAKSPLAQPQASILGAGGLLSTATGLLGGGQNPLQAALTVGKTVATWKSAGGINGLINSGSQEARTILNQTLTQTQQNAQTGVQQISVPTPSQTLSNKLLSGLRPPKR